MSSMTQTVQSSTTIQEPSTTAYCASPLPDHTQLPDKDGSFVKNYQEPPQADLGVAESRYESGRNRNFPKLKIMD
jgi:hypothetical protein